MYEYEICNNVTGEHYFIYGRNEANAWKRNPNLNRNEWKVIFCEYID